MKAVFGFLVFIILLDGCTIHRARPEVSKTGLHNVRKTVDQPVHSTKDHAYYIEDGGVYYFWMMGAQSSSYQSRLSYQSATRSLTVPNFASGSFVPVRTGEARVVADPKADPIIEETAPVVEIEIENSQGEVVSEDYDPGFDGGDGFGGLEASTSRSSQEPTGDGESADSGSSGGDSGGSDSGD